MSKLKFLLKSAGVAAVATTLFAGAAFAGLPGGASGGWVTNFQLQNAGTAAGTVSVDAYDTAGVATKNISTTTVAQGGSVTFLASQLFSAAFNGSGVVSSDQPMYGIMFVTNFTTAGPNTASAIVRTVDSASTGTKLYYPLAKQNFGGGRKTTTFYVQNAGTAAATITATINTASACTNNPRSFPIPVGAQVNFTPVDLGCPTSAVLGSVIVDASQPVAGVYLEHDDAAPVDGIKVVQGTNAFVASDASNTLIAPIIKRSFGANRNRTGIQILNLSPRAIPTGTMTISYTVVAAGGGVSATVGQVFTETNTTEILIGQSYNSLHSVLPILGDFNAPMAGASAGTLASAVVFTNDPSDQLVAIVNENRPNNGSFSPASGVPGRNTTYGAFGSNKATAKVNLPLVKEKFGGQGGRCTGVQVFSVGAPAIMRMTYANTAGSMVATTNSAVASKTFLNVHDVNGGTTDITVTGSRVVGNYSVVLDSPTAGAQFVAVANESFCPGSIRNEDDANYEGFGSN